jgi:hypothetical protein
MGRDQEIAGDYGYDLAHEEIGPVTARGGTTGESHGSAPPARDKDEPSEDLSYDEAHGF